MAKQKSATPGQTPISGWLQYVAGYLDGEGSFLYGSSPEVAVTNCFPYTLYKLQESFGGTVLKREPHPVSNRTIYQWRVYGDHAVDLIKQVRPYLWEKLPQADLVLRIRGLKPGPQRAGLVAQLKKLKKLDYGGMT